MRLRIVYQDEFLVCVEKPPGFHVHPPEDQRHKIPASRNCLHLLRTQIDKYLYPVHRLDGATSGILVFALQKDAAKEIQRQFQEREVFKTYVALVRGWTDECGVVDSPLSGADAITRYERLAPVELPDAVGRYATSRYSLIRVHPETGRMHQIRRHFAHLRHPLVGDTIYGDSKHNRFFREKIPGSGLFLKAHSMRFRHPRSGEEMTFRARWGNRWNLLFDLLGVCPLI